LYALSNKNQEPKISPGPNQKWYKDTVAVIITFIHNVTVFVHVFHFSAFHSLHLLTPCISVHKMQMCLPYV
jgi:hypothetical protein